MAAFGYGYGQGDDELYEGFNSSQPPAPAGPPPGTQGGMMRPPGTASMRGGGLG
eukprot:CAMPEP_0119087168 /NCGR_PEP_ID=MMETSP1178-20130426/140621_1 /TAXON_ID=33656 /ORGANISM="unid sp, Strain CCMP2000" /LENGTH=53 /DNA_ID=CAMNT_0007070351 /DNA_START=45 /DNA_END=203 /DNA_ORIENTATION=+